MITLLYRSLCLLAVTLLSFTAMAQSGYSPQRYMGGSQRYYQPTSKAAYSGSDVMMARSALYRAVQDYKNKDYKSAEKNLDIYLKYFGGDDDALYMRGFCRYLNNKDKYALRDLRRAIAMNPLVNKDLYTLIGTIYSQHNKHRKAIHYLKKSLKYYPKEAETYNNLGKAYQQIGEHRMAYSCYNTAISLNPDNAIIYNNRGCVLNVRYEHINYVHTNDIKQAITDFDMALAKDHKLAVAHKNKSVAYFLLKQYDEALAEVNRSIELDSSDPTAFFQRAKIHTARKNFDAAFGDLAYCLLKDSTNSFAIKIEQGNVMLAQEEYSEAISHFNQLVKHASYANRAFIHYKIAQCHALNQNEDLCVKELRKAARMGYFAKASHVRKFLADDNFKSVKSQEFIQFKQNKSKRFL